MAFKKATRKDAYIKIAISGVSGSGKTFSALQIAKGLGGKTALLDTEYGRASLYSDFFDFDVWDEQDPAGFPPEYFVRVIKAAEEAGYQNLIIDSISHEWSGRGGCLELVDAIAKARCKGNSYIAWGEVTPRHNKLVEAILSAKLNIVCTMRAKSEYVLNKDEKTGKTSPQKVGLGTVQRDGIEYEFTVMFELDRDSHIANAGKDNTFLFKDPGIITEETGRKIAQWLSTSKPEQSTSTTKKQNPRDYIHADYNNQKESGKQESEIYAHYSEILQMDVMDWAMLGEKDCTTLARALFIENKQKETVNA